MVRGHHERWDGYGYPDGSPARSIALSARIVCVADVFDALTTDRPYRRGFTREEALMMMAAERGKTFDPDLFARFERLIRGDATVSFAGTDAGDRDRELDRPTDRPRPRRGSS